MAAALSNLAHMQFKLCDWRGLDDLIAEIVDVTKAELAAGRRPSAAPSSLLATGAPFELQMAVTRAEADAIGESVAALREPSPEPPPAPGGRLRVAYLSPDFRGHSAGRLFRTLLEAHDRDRFEWHGYSLAGNAGAATRWFREAFDGFRDLSNAGHAEAARQIRADGIHVLVDLASHTRGARPEILALQPAPVQCHYLGYNLPLGADWCPWLVADPVSFANSSSRAALPATLAMLEGPWAAAAPFSALTPMPRRAAGLPDDAFVVANFNAAQKLDPAMWAVWMRVLSGAPRAVLWMLDPGATARRNLAREAAAAGIDPARIVWAQPLPRDRHLGRLACADVAVDTHLFKGGATALEMLCAGVPVVSLRDPGPARCASLLEAAGLPELAAKDLADYELILARLALEPERTAGLRDRLIAARETAPLFDTARWARDVEAAYGRMWAAHETA